MMIELSKENRDVIAQYPWKSTLKQLQPTLRNITGESVALSYDGLPPVAVKLSKQEGGHLKSHTGIDGHDSARRLHSKIGDRDLAIDLSTIFVRIRSNDFIIDQFRPLMGLIVDGASDLDIWKAIFHLISRTSTTPPPSSPPIYPDMPMSHSSASQRGSEQTRTLVTPRIFEEIRTCTYRDVGGFFSKYFENTLWEEQANKTIEAAKPRHVGGRWSDYPDPPEQTQVLEWLFNLQNDFFSNELGSYYMTHNRALLGSDAKRQLNLSIRRKTSSAIKAEHKWKDVRIIGELKAGDEKGKGKKLLLQLAAYAREVFST